MTHLSGEDPCWGIVGSYDRVTDLNDRPGYGQKPYSPSTFAAMFDDAVRSFCLYVAVMRYIEEVRAQHSLSRDRARGRHQSFSTRRLRQLRDEVLTTSLDLPGVARDTEILWNDRWRSRNGIDIRAEAAPDTPEDWEVDFDLVEQWGEARSQGFEELLADEETYRTVLATVASLGSSADATRMSRLALAIAAVSLIVAVISLLIAEPGSDSLWSTFNF